MIKDKNLNEKVYQIVKQIPRGKVVTYSQIALKMQELGEKITPRMVGRALHQNPDPKRIPCHRVVNYQGKLAEKYAFGGARAQKKRLLTEEVGFIDATHVNLKTSGIITFK